MVFISKKGIAINIIACLLFILMIYRAIAFWSADPMPAYANNFDQIRFTFVFGIKPRDSSEEWAYAQTPEQPWRYFKQSDSWHKILYPSIDLLFKTVQYATMRIFAQSDGSMDIKIGTIPVLSGLLLGMGYIFLKMTRKPFTALGFALWGNVVFDPVNLLFLNTWYTEFSVFAVTVLLIGTAWLWVADLISTRSMMKWVIILLLAIALSHNQYMYIMLVAAPLAALIMLKEKRGRGVLFGSKKIIFIIIIPMLPVLVFSGAFGRLGLLNAIDNPITDAVPKYRGFSMIEILNNANRADTVFGALLPATNDQAGMMKDLGLPYDKCKGFIGKNWYDSWTDFERYCPEITKLPLFRIGIAAIKHPAAIHAIIQTISRDHRGFLQNHLGQIEGSKYSKITSESGFTYFSFDQLLAALPGFWITIIIYICALGPGVAGITAMVIGKFRWGIMLIFNCIMFNYILLSSILGDGYYEIGRHVILCFSYGAMFFVFLLIGCYHGMHKLIMYLIQRIKYASAPEY